MKHVKRHMYHKDTKELKKILPIQAGREEK